MWITINSCHANLNQVLNQVFWSIQNKFSAFRIWPDVGSHFSSVLSLLTSDAVWSASGTQNGWKNKKKTENKAIGVFNFFTDLCSKEDSDLTEIWLFAACWETALETPASESHNSGPIDEVPNLFLVWNCDLFLWKNIAVEILRRIVVILSERALFEKKGIAGRGRGKGNTRVLSAFRWTQGQ